jgi:hypothetical protein
MRVVFLHGINQQGKNSQQIRSDWLSYLANPAFLAGKDVVAPFYGDILAGRVDAGTTEQAIRQGIASDDEERAFVANALQQIALDRGLTGDAIVAEEQAVAQGPLDDRRFLAILRLLERILPLQGRWLLPIIRQAYAYLRRPDLTDAIDGVVVPVLSAGPCIVIGHSLGSVVGFKLLRQLGHGVPVPLFMTLGSPLGIDAVKAALARPRRMPDGVARWFNGLDPDDLVTMGKALTAQNFAGGIENKADIDNGPDAHAIEGYLRDATVRQMISAAVGTG